MSGFRENGHKNKKSGHAMFSALLSLNIMPNFGKIVGAVFERQPDGRTDRQTEAILQLPSVFNRGPITQNS
jgi:hypothetical protein